jgi:3-oxoadipate enol-lactonase
MPSITTTDGVQIHYQVEGRADGRPLLFSNSLGTNLHLWDGQAEEALGLGFRVIRYDQRGHGKSEAPDGDYELPRLGKDVIDLLDALKIERTAYCGLSMGAMTGVWLAMHRSRRFSRLALCSVAVWMPPRDFWDTRIATVEGKGMAGVVDQVVERWFTAEFRKTNKRGVGKVAAMIAATDPVGYIGCCAAIRDMDLRDRLGVIEAPALVVVGAHDPATPPERGQYVVDHIPGAQKVVLAASHLSNIEQPEEFNRAVFGFLKGNIR